MENITNFIYKTYSFMGGCMKKPKVFANPIEKRLYNNQEVFDSETNIESNNIDGLRNTNNQSNYLYIEEDDYRNLSIVDKIEKLLNRNGYIFNVDVVIKTNDRVYETKIAGKVNNHLITLDNDIINISDIIDLEVKL